MQRFFIINGPRIRWRLSLNSPKYLKLKSIPGYHFLNPYWFGDAYKRNGCVERGDGILINEQFQLHTIGIILKNVTETIDDQAIEFLFNNLGILLKYLKYTSKQFNLKADGSVVSMFRSEKIAIGVCNDIRETTQMMIRGDYYHSMASWDNLKQADNLCHSNYNIPVYEDILLDAIEGRTSHEYRKAILYATIAIESMLANLYDEQYKKLIKKNTKGKKFRFVSQNGIDKDPIFKALSDKTDFRKLLHEIPLYLNDKSLLIVNEQLYTNALKLYTTRNKIK